MRASTEVERGSADEQEGERHHPIAQSHATSRCVVAHIGRRDGGDDHERVDGE